MMTFFFSQLILMKLYDILFSMKFLILSMGFSVILIYGVMMFLYWKKIFHYPVIEFCTRYLGIRYKTYYISPYTNRLSYIPRTREEIQDGLDRDNWEFLEFLTQTDEKTFLAGSVSIVLVLVLFSWSCVTEQ